MSKYKDGDTIQFPLTTISSMSLRRPNKDGNFQIILKYADTVENEGIKAAIAAVNPKLIIDNTVNKAIEKGHFLIKLKTKAIKSDGSTTFLDVRDEHNQFIELEDRPGFNYETDSGQACAVAVVYNKEKSKQPTLFLKKVGLVGLDIKPREQSADSKFLEEQLKSLHNG